MFEMFENMFDGYNIVATVLTNLLVDLLVKFFGKKVEEKDQKMYWEMLDNTIPVEEDIIYFQQETNDPDRDTIMTDRVAISKHHFYVYREWVDVFYDKDGNEIEEKRDGRVYYRGSLDQAIKAKEIALYLFEKEFTNIDRCNSKEEAEKISDCRSQKEYSHRGCCARHIYESNWISDNVMVELDKVETTGQYDFEYKTLVLISDDINLDFIKNLDL